MRRNVAARMVLLYSFAKNLLSAMALRINLKRNAV